MTVVDDPIERLNYFNGLRLAAEDLVVEQSYHIEVRRRLTAALFSPGIATGLEVTAAPGDAHSVVVSPGVAIDSQGREIILVAPQTVRATGTPSTQPGVVFGNYLIIAYGEDRASPTDRACAGAAAGVNLATGAPSRIVLDPQLSFQDAWPSTASGLIVICQVELDANTSQVKNILTGMRKYVTASKPSQTTPISIEGEKDIDADNAKELHFHITGGVPSTANLYLYGDKFSSLFYTELGNHTHDNKISLNTMPDLAKHTHPLSALTTDKQLGGGVVQAVANTYSGAVGDFAVRLWQPSSETTNLTVGRANFTLQGIEHAHTIAAGGATNASTDIGDTTPKGTLSNAGAGVTDVNARAGTALGYINGLRVTYDNTDITDNVLKQINDRLSSQGHPTWATIGSGHQSDGLTTGSGAIDLIALGLDLSVDQHTLVFSVPSGGGKIKYNLYVS